MGYRGNVKIKCKKEDFKYFQEAFEENKREGDDPLYPATFKEDGDSYILCWYDTTWYDGLDDEVTRIMDVVRELSENAESFSYVYVGDGSMDNSMAVEEICGTSGYSDLYVHCSIKGDEDAVDITPPWEN